MSIRRSRPRPGAISWSAIATPTRSVARRIFRRPRKEKSAAGATDFPAMRQAKSEGARCRKDPHLPSPRKEQGYRIWFSSHDGFVHPLRRLFAMHSHALAGSDDTRSVGPTWAKQPVLESVDICSLHTTD